MPALLAFLLGALCAAAPAQTKTHEDPGHGFSFQVPKRFKRLPVEKDRHCVLAHYISTRGYPIPGVRWLTHRPSIRVVHLPKPTPKALEASKQASKATDKPKQTQVYDDYRDYLKRNLSGELSFENADQTAVAGLVCTKLGVNRHETGRDYYLQTWIFERGALTYAIEVMVISSQRKKLWPELNRCLESFQLAGTPPGRQPARLSVPLWRKDPARWQKLGAEQRAKERKAFEEEVFEHVENNLLPGWRLEHTDNCLFVTDSKDRYVSIAKLAAERCRGLLQNVFGEVNDEHVMKPVIRIFDSPTDYRYYRIRSQDGLHYVEPIHEIVVRSRGQGKEVGDLEDLHSGLAQHYLDSKSAGLPRHLPRWMQAGLHRYLRLSQVRGSRWELAATAEEKAVIRDAHKRKQLLMPSAIMHERNEPWRDSDTELGVQRARWIRFLLQKGKGRKLLPDLLQTYAAAVSEVQKTFPLEPRLLGRGDVPEDVREARDKQARRQRRRLLKAVNQTVLAFDKKKWKAVDLAWRRYVPK